MPCTDQDCRHCTHSDAVAATYAREIALQLITETDTLTSDGYAAWIGRATAVLRELTRHA